jgi:hypothetical protein
MLGEAVLKGMQVFSSRLREKQWKANRGGGFKMLLCALVIKGRLWVRFTVDGGGRSQ